MNNSNPSIVRRWWLYILKLESDKWYVGITSKQPSERFEEHRLGKRAAYWTMKYKPLEIELIEDLGIVSKEHAEKYENKIARLLMKERGLNNVRGGDLTYTEEHVARLGKYYKKDDWEDIKYSVASLVAIILLIVFIVDKYLFPFLPGGVK